MRKKWDVSLGLSQMGPVTSLWVQFPPRYRWWGGVGGDEGGCGWD